MHVSKINDMSAYHKSVNRTNDRMLHLKSGMRFSERMSVWLHILEVNESENTVKTIYANVGDNVPPDCKVAEVPIDIFHQRFQYSVNNTNYWIDYVDEDNDFSEWLDLWDSFEKDDGYDKYMTDPEVIKYRTTPLLHKPTGKGLTDHQIQELVNVIRDNVEPLTKAQQLREHIASATTKYLESKGLRIDKRE